MESKILRPATLESIQDVFKDPNPGYEIALGINPDCSVEVMTRPCGYLRQFLKARTYLQPRLDQVCDKMFQPKEFDSHVLQEQIKSDKQVLARHNITEADIAKRVFELVGKMEVLVEQKKGLRISSQAERVYSLMNKKFECSKWSGRNYLKYLPEINEQWVILDEQQAEFDGYCVSRVIWGGAHECPFQDPNDKTYYGYQYGNMDFVIQRLDTGDAIAISSLTLHTIAKHSFFQFPKHPYRLHPRKLIRILF